jgi:hypothetical protein
MLRGAQLPPAAAQGGCWLTVQADGAQVPLAAAQMSVVVMAAWMKRKRQHREYGGLGSHLICVWEQSASLLCCCCVGSVKHASNSWHYMVTPYSTLQRQPPHCHTCDHPSCVVAGSRHEAGATHPQPHTILQHHSPLCSTCSIRKPNNSLPTNPSVQLQEAAIKLPQPHQRMRCTIQHPGIPQCCPTCVVAGSLEPVLQNYHTPLCSINNFCCPACRTRQQTAILLHSRPTGEVAGSCHEAGATQPQPHTTVQKS